jgi:guanine deaminase
MARAIELAVGNVRTGRGGPFGAVVARNGGIIAEGVNSVTLKSDPTAHAEVSAIREACSRLHTFELNGCELYTSCEPCPMCLGAIYWARLERVFYAASAADAAATGFDDELIYKEISREPASRKIPMAALMRTEALAAFRAWQESGNKTPY